MPTLVNIFLIIVVFFKDTIIAGVWFIADYGTMGINYIFTGEAKGISDMIDESIGTYELYEGIY